MLIHILKKELSDSLARDKHNTQPDILVTTFGGVGMRYKRCNNADRSYAESPWGGLEGGGVIYVFFAHRKLFFQNIPTNCIILHFAMCDV